MSSNKSSESDLVALAEVNRIVLEKRSDKKKINCL